MIEKKRFSSLNRLCMLVLLSYFLVFPGSQVMGEWSCPFIETSTSTEGNTLTYTINLTNPNPPLLPNEISIAYMTVDYDPEQLSFSDFDGFDYSGCLIDYVQLDYHDHDNGEVYMTVYAFSPIPITEDGCLFKMIFTKIGENAKEPFIKDIGKGVGGDFCPDGECWCPTPMTCHINVIPAADVVYSEENINFITEILYCNNPPSCEWNAECDSSIVPNDMDSCKALYTAGIPKLACSDTVTVTDIGNEHVKEEYSTATANIHINASVVINPEKSTKPADYPTVGSGSSVQFEADTPFCDGATHNAWSVESSIGSEIHHVSGLYQAGREFTSCDDAVDIVKVNAVCPDDGVERIAEENVTIPACQMIISPSSITVASGDTVTFFNSLDACCTKPPEPEYSWELQSAIGSTIFDNPPNKRFLYRAGNNTGSQDFGETITVADSEHLNATDEAIVIIRPLPAPCVSGEDCDDQNTCTDDSCVDEQCVYECNATGPNDECCVDPACEGTTICSRCTGDNDCNNLDRDDYCDGNVVKHDEGKCVENQCEAKTTIVENCDDDDDGLYCTGDVICVDGSCGYSGDPCLEGKTCVEETRQCTTTIAPIEITASPDPMMRSRWVMLPTWVVISGENTSFSQLTSRVSYSPSTAMLSLPALVLGPEIIWQLVFVNPPWLAEFPGDPQTVTATVDGGSYDFEIQLLPFILDQK